MGKPETSSAQSDQKSSNQGQVPGRHEEFAFVDGNVKYCQKAKALLKKANKHCNSKLHGGCVETQQELDEAKIEKAAEAADAKFIEKHRENVDATVFCTAFECANSHLSFREHERLIELQTANGLKCGNMLYAHHACSNIIAHAASCMRTEIVNYTVANKCKLSVLIDESTSISNVQTLIVYIRFL